LKNKEAALFLAENISIPIAPNLKPSHNSGYEWCQCSVAITQSIDNYSFSLGWKGGSRKQLRNRIKPGVENHNGE